MDKDKKYVWYACYGSNLLRERFMLYVQGGVCRFVGKEYDGCRDKTAPLEDRPLTIPYKLYFGNRSSRWESGGVAFLEPVKDDGAATLGRMYLITEEQFEDIRQAEGPIWYDMILDLGMIDGIPVRTFTHSSKFSERKPGWKYMKVIEEGVRETYPELSDKEVEHYVKSSF